MIHNLLPTTPDARLQLSMTQLEPIFSSFVNQLLSLLGVPDLPSSISVDTTGSKTSILTDWQLENLLRQRILENVRSSQDTLSSIIKLVDQIENMPVKQDVKNDINGALNALDDVGRSYHIDSLIHMSHCMSSGVFCISYFSPSRPA